MNDLEINIQDLLGKMKNRIAEDAQKIAMLEATADIYSVKLLEYENKIAEMEKQIKILREMKEQQ